MKKSWFEIKAQGGIPELFIYDEIGGWGIRAKDLIDQVQRLQTKNLILHINSPGGDVFDGLAIYNYLKNSDINVTTKIEGIAASMAGIVAIGGNKVEMAENSMLMIHDPVGGQYGKAEELRNMAGLLDKITEQMVTSYVRKSGLKEDEVREMMSETTWLTSKEAKEMGFVDLITDEIQVAAKAAWESYYDDFPKINQGEKSMDEKLLKMLGLKDEASVLPLVQGLQTKVETLETENENLKESQVGLQVDLAIAGKKIAPSQKDFAIKMAKLGEDVYMEWLEQNKPQVPSGMDEIPEGQDDLTADELLADADKFAAMEKNDPAKLKSILAKAGITV